jgi:hypothetical protein
LVNGLSRVENVREFLGVAIGVKAVLQSDFWPYIRVFLGKKAPAGAGFKQSKNF